jgi:hypothetical protein
MEFWCCAQAKDYGYILNTGKYARKVKRFRVSAETEEKIINEQTIKLIKGTINSIDVNLVLVFWLLFALTHFTTYI